jgi:hypothetical protein
MSSNQDVFPVGAVIPFAGILPGGAVWLKCNGEEVSADEYAELADLLDYAYGGDREKKRFRLPDYRGTFLRGTDRGAGVDPDAGRREAVDGVGAGGDQVGTVQDWATARPHKPFRGRVPHLPTGTWTGSAATMMTLTGTGGGHVRETLTGGGDPETRPVNVYVEYYIKARA